MDGHLHIIHVLAVISCTFTGALCQTACSDPSQRGDACLEGIRQSLQDRTRFWFGTDFIERCTFPSTVLECFSFSRARPLDQGNSLVDLMYYDGAFDPATITQYIDVTYTSPPGSYQGCGHEYTISESMTFDLDPLSDQSYEPWYARLMPEITWEGEADTYYTVLMLDPGVGVVHGGWMNILGNNMNTAQTLKAYLGPGNPVNIPNVYIFLLFKQNTGNMTILEEWKTAAVNMGTFSLGKMVQPEHMNLTGPLAANWLLVPNDPYSIQRFSTFIAPGATNCVRFIKSALESHSRPFLPDDLDTLSMYVNLTMDSPQQSYQLCCNQHDFPAETLVLDPIGNGTFPPITVKTGTPISVKLLLNKMSFQPSTEFTGKYFTMLAFDPDVPLLSPPIATNERPLLHWLHINLQVSDGALDLSGGRELQAYGGPMPPDDKPHTYYFLVLEQTAGMMDMVDHTQYNGNCTARIATRCLFDVRRFLAENDLDLVGVTWLNSETDDWVRMRNGGVESEVCAGRAGYADPCPTGGSPAVVMYEIWMVMAVMAGLLLL